VIQDDVVMEHVVLKSNPAFDIAQVEVLRGPQGSLFGRNTTAGIVKFDTAQPTATWAGQASASWGSRNSDQRRCRRRWPLTADGRISFRLSGLYQHRDNWINNTYTGVSDDGTKPGNNVMGGFNERDVRLQLLAQPTETLSLRLSGHYRDYDGSASIFYRGSIQKGTHTVPANLDLTNVAYDEGGNNPQAYKTKGVSLKAVQDLGSMTLTSITAYEASHGSSRGDTDGGAAAERRRLCEESRRRAAQPEPVEPGTAPRQPGRSALQVAAWRHLLRLARLHRVRPARTSCSATRGRRPTPTTGCRCTTSTPAGRVPASMT
jgi:iron complex outermembrane receptor protein